MLVGAVVRQQDPLAQAKRQTGAHLGDALKRRFAREGCAARVARGGEIAEAEAGIIVARPYDPVEVYFAEHRYFQFTLSHPAPPLPGEVAAAERLTEGASLAS